MKPNKYIEEWGVRREHIENEFRCGLCSQTRVRAALSYAFVDQLCRLFTHFISLLGTAAAPEGEFSR